MKSNLHYNPRITTLKLLTQISNTRNINHQLLTYWHFHSYFFTYRQNFLNPTYKILGSRVSDLQLTYMDSAWDTLSTENVLKLSYSTLNKTPKRYSNKNIINSRLSLPQLILSILKSSLSFLKPHVRLRLPNKYINSYYLFLTTRSGPKQRNYIQKLNNWYTHYYKREFTQSTYQVSHKRLKHLRRLKVRTLRTLSNPTKINKKLSGLNWVNYRPIILTNLPNYYKLIAVKSISTLLHKTTSLRLNKNPQRRPRRKINKVKLLNTFQLKSTKYLTRIKLKSPISVSPNRVLRRYSLLFWKYNMVVKSSFTSVAKSHMWRAYIPSHKILQSNALLNATIKASLHETNYQSTSLHITTRSLKSFILRNSGLNILSKQNWQNIFPAKLKSQFKKKLFSFVYPGQAKKNILLRRKKQVLTRLLTKSTNLITSIDRFSYQLFHQLFTTEQFLHKNNSLLSNFSKANINSPLTNSSNLNNVYYSFDFQTKGIDLGDLHVNAEVRIPRVRFKPGYQRIWRQVRSALKVALNVKFQYQQQLTKYLTKFYHLSNQYLLSYSESTLDKIIIYSQLLPDISTTELFSTQGFIYLNGTVTLTTNTILIKNDFVQLVVSLWYYIINRWFLNWTNQRVRKFKRLVYRKNKPLQYKIMKNKKQQSYYTPNWIDQTRYDNTDIKSYLEVDFFTLSTFVLTDTYIQHYHSINDMPDLRNSTYMLYNWKYIT